MCFLLIRASSNGTLFFVGGNKWDLFSNAINGNYLSFVLLLSFLYLSFEHQLLFNYNYTQLYREYRGGWLYNINHVFLVVQRSAVPSSTCLLTVDTNVQMGPTLPPAVSSSAPLVLVWRARKPQPASTTKRGAPESLHVLVSQVCPSLMEPA